MTEEKKPDTTEPTPKKKERLLGKRRFFMLIQITEEHVAGLKHGTWFDLTLALEDAVKRRLKELAEKGKAELAKQTKEQLELELAETRLRQQDLQQQLAKLEGR